MVVLGVFLKKWKAVILLNSSAMKLCPPLQDLSKHYKELLQKKHNPTIKQPKESKNFQNFDPLNWDNTIEEIKQKIKKLKNKKAPGNDSITNEMIKYSDDLMLVKLEKLFKKAFKTGYYPNS